MAQQPRVAIEFTAKQLDLLFELARYTSLKELVVDAQERLAEEVGNN